MSMFIHFLTVKFLNGEDFYPKLKPSKTQTFQNSNLPKLKPSKTQNN